MASTGSTACSSASKPRSARAAPNASSSGSSLTPSSPASRRPRRPFAPNRPTSPTSEALMPVWGSVLVVLGLIIVEGVFVASEMALVTLREGQLRAIAERGRRGEKVARLVENPNRFLSAVQIGVTTTALLSSAFGAITLSDSLADELRDAGLGHNAASVIGFLVVTLLIAYVTLVVGELAPKRLALQRSEST